MPKEHVIIFALLCIMAFGAGYWHSASKVDSDERVEVVAPPAPTIVTNVVTNIVTAIPQPTHTPVKSRPTPARQLTLEEKYIVGTYEFKDGNLQARWVFLDKGFCEYYVFNKVRLREKWKIVGNEVHVPGLGQTKVFIISPDGILTHIAMDNFVGRTQNRNPTRFRRIK